MHWVSELTLLPRHKKGYVKGESEDLGIMQLELFEQALSGATYILAWYAPALETMINLLNYVERNTTQARTPVSGNMKSKLIMQPADCPLTDLYLASVGCSTIFRSTLDKISAAAPFCGAILSKANASFCASVGSSSSAIWPYMQLESVVQAMMPYVHILASLHDAAPEFLLFCICIALTLSSETGIKWAASASLLQVQVSDVMINILQPGNMSTWGSVGPSGQD